MCKNLISDKPDNTLLNYSNLLGGSTFFRTQCTVRRNEQTFIATIVRQNIKHKEETTERKGEGDTDTDRQASMQQNNKGHETLCEKPNKQLYHRNIHRTYCITDQGHYTVQ